MSQQTAIEWFFDKLKNHEIQAEHFELYQQAKAMEKEQMIKFTNECFKNYLSVRGYKTPEQYYNETYGSQGSPDTSSHNIKNK